MRLRALLPAGLSAGILLAACGAPTPSASASPTPVAAAATVSGVVVVAPCRPVERAGDPPCPPVPGIVIHFLPAGGGTALDARTDATGTYRIQLPAGEYDARAVGGISGRPATHVSILNGASVTLNFTIDSGIR